MQYGITKGLKELTEKAKAMTDDQQRAVAEGIKGSILWEELYRRDQEKDFLLNQLNEFHDRYKNNLKGEL